MIITSSGRPVAKFPLWRLRDGEGGWFLSLSRVDVSDVRKSPVAEGFYEPLIKEEARDGMTTYQIRVGTHVNVFFVTNTRFYFIPLKRIQHYGYRDYGYQTPEE